MKVSLPQTSWRSFAASRLVSEQYPASTSACLGWQPVFCVDCGGDDLVFFVHDGLGVVCRDGGAVAVLHDPRVGVGEVGLSLRLGPGLGGSLLAGVGDSLLFAGPARSWRRLSGDGPCRRPRLRSARGRPAPSRAASRGGPARRADRCPCRRGRRSGASSEPGGKLRHCLVHPLDRRVPWFVPLAVAPPVTSRPPEAAPLILPGDACVYRWVEAPVQVHKMTGVPAELPPPPASRHSPAVRRLCVDGV